MNQDAPERDIEDLSFEAALSELETLVRRLEEGKITLDEFDPRLRAGDGAEAAL